MIAGSFMSTKFPGKFKEIKFDVLRQLNSPVGYNKSIFTLIRDSQIFGECKYGV